ncbi:HMGL-like domain-containing protein [Desulfonema limicola]|uniref:HMGL-like domain-containing protein n=1 Tax=Desulfonema limicola TaxID=45656 RepID=A0A975BDY1_9BACT|nr:hypothetical protein [Desulfonema limicola]QTA83409.1 HMGL-like domain-containing protein [Desulfonema limicola]
MNKSSEKKIWIIDSTLRDGEQAPGVVFSTGQKLVLSKMLVQSGVNELEAGIPAMGIFEQDCIKRIKALNPGTRITCWCRAAPLDMELAKQCNTGSVHISFPVSLIHMNILKMNQDKVLELLQQYIKSARSDFNYLSIGAQDATRADPEFLKEFVFLACKSGADRVRIADTVGIASPKRVSRIIYDLKNNIPDIDIEFHAHNDLGMATANAVTAVQSGADAVSVTVNGLGERAGNAALEEVCTALKFSAGQSCSINILSLKSLCDFVARISRRPIPAEKPVTGRAAFEHESGIHCNAMIKDPQAYESFPAEAVGRKDRKFIIGKHSGTGIISHILENLGIFIDHSQTESLLKYVKMSAIKNGKSLSVNELVLLYHQMQKQSFSG